MRKYIIALLGVTVFSMIMLLCYKHSDNMYYQYNNTYPHSRLVKEIVLNVNDTSYDKKWYQFKQIYRKYNYGQVDSIEYTYSLGDSIYVRFYMTHVGDTSSIEYYRKIQ